jgi:hypothetical protein
MKMNLKSRFAKNIGVSLLLVGLLSLSSCETTAQKFYKEDFLKDKYESTNLNYVKEELLDSNNKSFVVIDGKTISLEFRIERVKSFFILNNKWELEIERTDNYYSIGKWSFAYFEDYLFFCYKKIVYKFDNETNLIFSKAISAGEDLNHIYGLFVFDSSLIIYRFSSIANTNSINAYTLENIDTLTFSYKTFHSNNSYLYYSDQISTSGRSTFWNSYDTPNILEVGDATYILVAEMLFKLESDTWTFIANKVLEIQNSDGLSFKYYENIQSEEKVKLFINRNDSISLISEFDQSRSPIFLTESNCFTILEFSKQGLFSEYYKSSVLVTNIETGITKYFSFFEETFFLCFAFSPTEANIFFRTSMNNNSPISSYKINLLL